MACLIFHVAFSLSWYHAHDASPKIYRKIKEMKVPQKSNKEQKYDNEEGI